MARTRTILLTGACGVLGTALDAALAGHRVVRMWRRTPPGGPGPAVSGDLTEPLLGLSPTVYRDLAAEVDMVVHCAALTDFGAPPEQTRTVNVDGTRRVAEFAVTAQARLCHVSTAYVDAPVDSLPGPYITSKREAEHLVRDLVPDAAVVRPSIVIGDAESGRTARRQGVHALIGAAIAGHLPLLPILPPTRVDLVPQDFVARAVAGLVDADLPGGTWRLTSGPAAPTIAELVTACQQVAAAHGTEVATPRHVPPDMVARLIRPVFLQSLPRGLRRRLDGVLSLAELLGRTEPFGTDLDDVPGAVAPTPEAVLEAFRAMVRDLLPDTPGSSRAVA